MSKMIKCKKCGYKFEIESKACPNCNAKAPINIKKLFLIFIAVILAVLFVVLTVKMLLDDGSGTVNVSSKQDNTSIGDISSVDNELSNEQNISSIITSSSITTNTDVAGAYKQPTDKDNNIVVSNNGTVSITIPKWFLFKIEPNYDYKLTDKEANIYKFKSVSKNSDGSATYTVEYNDYHKFLLTAKSAVNAVVYEYSNNAWFSKIETDDGYNNIKIYTKYDSLDSFDDGFGIYIATSGTQATFYQYMHYNYSVGTKITVYNKDNKVLATYEFPELIK